MPPNGNPIPKIEIWKGERLIFNDEELSCLSFIRKVTSECKVRWSLHKAFLDAWQGKVPTEVWLDVISEGIDMTCLLLDGLPMLRLMVKAQDTAAVLSNNSSA